MLAVRLDNVGDVVMPGPALRDLHHHLPGARVTLMASPKGSQAAPLLEWVDEVMVERVVWEDGSSLDERDHRPHPRCREGAEVAGR